MKSIKEIQEEIFRFGKIIDAPESYLKIGNELSDVVINVEIHGDEYHYVVVERGEERKRLITKSSSDIIYLFIQSASHAVASSYEVRNRIPRQDFRRFMFQHQLELLQKLKPEWADRRQKEIDEILKKHPFDDEEFNSDDTPLISGTPY